MEFCCWHQFAYQGKACLTMQLAPAAAMHQAYTQLVDRVGVLLMPIWSLYIAWWLHTVTATKHVKSLLLVS
jgi:hypothetical protein